MGGYRHTDNEQVLYSTRCTLALPGNEPEEAVCNITKNHLIINTKEPIKIPISHIKSSKPAFSPIVDDSTMGAIHLTYLDESGKECKLFLAAPIERIGYLDNALEQQITEHTLIKEIQEQSIESEESRLDARSFAEQVRCQGCGRFDHTLRVAIFPFVISIVVMSFKRAEAGIFCERCRSFKSTKWAVISLLFGIWGFPFGIFWTLQSIATNARKGETPKEENISLLINLAQANTELGRIDEAKASVNELLKYTHVSEVIALKDDLDTQFPHIAPAGVYGFRFGFTCAIVIVLAIYSLIGYSIFGTPQDAYVSNDVKPQITTEAQSYIDNVTSWVDRYGAMRDPYLDVVEQFVTYEQAISNSDLIIKESNLFITQAKTLLKEITNIASIPEDCIRLHSSLERFIGLEIEGATLFKESMEYQDISKWNQSIPLLEKINRAQQECIDELERLGIY